jgi:hypothetical protein
MNRRPQLVGTVDNESSIESSLKYNVMGELSVLCKTKPEKKILSALKPRENNRSFL